MGQNYYHNISFSSFKFLCSVTIATLFCYTQSPTSYAQNTMAKTAIKLASLPATLIEPQQHSSLSISALIVQQLQTTKAKKTKQAERKALIDFYQDHDNLPIWIGLTGFTDKAKNLMLTLKQADDYGLRAKDFKTPTQEPQNGDRYAQALSEVALSQALLKYAAQARGRRILAARLNHFFDLEPTLDNPADILEMAANSNNITAFLLSLHPEHQQFTALRYALIKHQESYKKKPSHKLKKTIIKLQMNMERWRLMPDNMARKAGIYIWTNIPELKTRVVQQNQTIFIEKAIVGKVSKQTPIFKDQLEWIEFFPTWYIPNSIKRNDLLPRLRRGNTKTLEKFNIKVDCGKHGRNPKTINWKKVDIRNCSVTQPPSKINVLGNLKFKFPNKHSVYMHDTDDRHLFKIKKRYMSHGCVRVQHPDKMAQILLSHARGAQAPNVKKILAGRRSMRKEVFSKPIPVYMTYFTMRVDSKGKLKSFPDVYGHDRRMAHLFTSNKALFPAPKVVKYKRPKRKPRQVKNNWRKEAF